VNGFDLPDLMWLALGVIVGFFLALIVRPK